MTAPDAPQPPPDLLRLFLRSGQTVEAAVAASSVEVEEETTSERLRAIEWDNHPGAGDQLRYVDPDMIAAAVVIDGTTLPPGWWQTTATLTAEEQP